MLLYNNWLSNLSKHIVSKIVHGFQKIQEDVLSWWFLLWKLAFKSISLFLQPACIILPVGMCSRVSIVNGESVAHLHPGDQLLSAGIDRVLSPRYWLAAAIYSPAVSAMR